MKGGIDSPEDWLDAHGDALYRYALVRLRDAHRAEEAVQETLLAALQARERFSGTASVRTWLIGILKHKIMDQFRREVREVSLNDPDDQSGNDDQTIQSSFSSSGRWSADLADWGNPEAALEQDQFWSLLHDCLDRIPRRLARLFMLREVMGESSDDICQELAITPANLWTMLYRARMGLRQCFERQWGEGGRR